MMSLEKNHVKDVEQPLTGDSPKKPPEEKLNIVSNIASIVGVTATIVAAVELSIPIMLIGTVVGAAAAITKLAALRQGSQQGAEIQKDGSNPEISKVNSDSSSLQ